LRARRENHRLARLSVVDAEGAQIAEGSAERRLVLDRRVFCHRDHDPRRGIADHVEQTGREDSPSAIRSA
jgi:hypothetical protein